MRAAVISVWAVIVTIFFVQTANGLQTSLLSVRAGMESFPAWTIGIVMASYYVGYSAAPLASRAVIGRAGHVNTMWIGILCAAPREGLGVSDSALRARVGEDRLTIFRRHDEE